MILQIIIIITFIILLIVAILNFSKTWGKLLTAVLIASILIFLGFLLYKYYKKRNTPPPATLTTSRCPPGMVEVVQLKNNIVEPIIIPELLIDPRQKLLFLSNDTISNANIQDYLQKDLVQTVKLFTEDYENIMAAISRYDISTVQANILILDDSRLFKFQKVLGKAGKIGTPYVFNVRGINIIIKVSKNINLFSRNYFDLDRYKCFDIYASVDNKNCFPNKNTINVVVGSSEYVNETVIGYLLNSIFFRSYWNGPTFYSVNGNLNTMIDLGHSVFQIGYFQNPYEKVGYNVMELCNNTLDNLFGNILDPTSDFHKIVFIYNGITYNSTTNPTKIFYIILQQINSLLLILKNIYSFNHGDLKGGNLFYRIEDSYLNIDYPIDAYDFFVTNQYQYKCRTNIRIKIADYGKASMTYNKTHYYCNDTYLNANKLSQYIVDPEKESVDSYIDKDGGKYLFDSTLPIVGLDISLRHLPCPYFLSADYYLLLTSLSLTSPEFFNFIETNGIYSMLGVSFDLKSKRPASITSAIQKLKGQFLKCDIMNSINNLSISKLIS